MRAKYRCMCVYIIRIFCSSITYRLLFPLFSRQNQVIVKLFEANAVEDAFHIVRRPATHADARDNQNEKITQQVRAVVAAFSKRNTEISV